MRVTSKEPKQLSFASYELAQEKRLTRREKSFTEKSAGAQLIFSFLATRDLLLLARTKQESG